MTKYKELQDNIKSMQELRKENDMLSRLIVHRLLKKMFRLEGYNNNNIKSVKIYAYDYREESYNLVDEMGVEEETILEYMIDFLYDSTDRFDNEEGTVKIAFQKEDSQYIDIKLNRDYNITAYINSNEPIDIEEYFNYEPKQKPQKTYTTLWAMSGDFTSEQQDNETIEEVTEMLDSIEHKTEGIKNLKKTPLENVLYWVGFEKAKRFMFAYEFEVVGNKDYIENETYYFIVLETEEEKED